MATNKVTLSPEFEGEVLKYLCQARHAKIWLPQMSDKNFDNPDNQIVFQLLKDFSDKYNSIPTFNEMMEYFNIQSEKQKLKQDVINILKRTIRASYKPIGGNVDFVQEQIVTFLKRRMTKNLIQQNADKIKEGDNEFFDFLCREMERIVRVGDVDMYAPEDILLFDDYNAKVNKHATVYPTYLHGLNRLTAVGGFRTPELIVFAGGPKSFKTGLMLNFAIDFAQSGVPVYYADCENGIGAIEDRLHQAMLKCTYTELKKGVYRKEMKSVLERSKALKGELAFGYYPAGESTVKDVESRLDLLREERGFVPKVVMWDYADLFNSVERVKGDDYLRLRRIYQDIIKFNVRRNVFSITASQVGREAFDKKSATAKDISGDFMKIGNCHAAFALNRTKDEKDEGFGRLEPIAQRMGFAPGKGHSVLLRIDESRMLVEEQSYMEMVEWAHKRIQNDDE